MRDLKFRLYAGSERMIQWEELRGLHVGAVFFNDPPDHYHLMQYTGLKDKNGVEIYESDIGKAEAGELTPIVAEVIWRHGGFGIMPTQNEVDTFGNRYTGEMLPFTDGYDSSFFEVIGNVHQNPELLA